MKQITVAAVSVA